VKLCKDCAHAVFPNESYVVPMCGHPESRRSVVNGELLTTCVTARGVCEPMGATNESICGIEATLFMERPPAPETKPGAIIMQHGDPVCIDAVYGKSWWKRLFGG
jgi:hypothetical protein